MAQLKMYWINDKKVDLLPLPEGYSFSKYTCEADKMAWVECCRNGLVSDEATEAQFDDSILGIEACDPYDDVFFLDYNGEHIGTITAINHTDLNMGNMHMVGMKTEFRGKGLGKYLNNRCIHKLSEEGVKFIRLTTDEWRKGAVKSYLTSGFLPVQYEMGMEERWQKVLEEYGIDSVDMLYEDCTLYKKIYRESLATKVKIGVVGARRGQTMLNYCKTGFNCEVVAICDNAPEFLKNAKEKYGEDGITYYDNFDEFIKHDMDGIVLANFANEHAPLAIKAMKAGKHVLSEVLPCQHLKEAVELIEAVEETGKIYAYAENYCYMPAPREMRIQYREGNLGKFEYGEGEYVHNCEPGWPGYSNCDPNHWRNTMSAFYYCTHSLGPVLHITGLRPVKVSGFEIPFNDRMYRMGAFAGAMAVEMVTLENGAVVKSVHGVGPARNSVWYSVYGSKGRLESAREDAEKGGVGTLYGNLDKNEGDNTFEVKEINTDDSLTKLAEESGHGGSDFYTMYHFIQAIKGNRNAEIVDVYEAMDMFLPGHFGYLSAMNNNQSFDIPNLREKSERDKWRNDTTCTVKEKAGDMYIPSYSKGNPEIPGEVYETLRAKKENKA